MGPISAGVFAENGVFVQIGELSERTGVSRRSIRYYEQKGLVSAHRTEKGWREYEANAVNRVLNVRELLQAGLTVEDIQRVEPCLDMEMVDFMACENADHAISMYQERLAVVDEKLAMLQRHRAELAQRIEVLRTQPGSADFDALLRHAQEV
ncbi:MerR family transcriptional regulator [Streptomyces parvus]|uniref:MerR family transcriptional regulator n=1 Tax=Streptomyces parvus TaxID=66428 RepID=UPI0036896B39